MVEEMILPILRSLSYCCTGCVVNRFYQDWHRSNGLSQECKAAKHRNGGGGLGEGAEKE